MNVGFTELLDNTNFLNENGVNIDAIKNSSVEDILEFINQSIVLSSIDDIAIDHSLLSHTASLALSGSGNTCAQVACRMERAKELSQFASFYSDCVYINNFLSDHLAHIEEDAPPNIEDLRRRFIDDLSVINYLKPLIKLGRIIPITPPNYCKHCLAQQSFGNKDDKRIDNAYKQLIQDYRDNAHVFLEKMGNVYLIRTEAPEYLLEHGFHGTLLKELPSIIKEMPRLMKAINSGHNVEMSKTLKDKTKFNHYLAGNVLSGVTYELAMTNSLNTSYLSGSSREINFIKNVTNNVDIERRNHIIEKYLTCTVPFLGDIDPLDVLQIRENEEESFILFRNSLNEVVREVSSQNVSIQTNEAKQIYHDILAPQLARLDTDIKSAKRLLVKDTRRTALGWSAAISFGLYTGLLPEGVAAAAAALGFTNVLGEFLGDTMKQSDSEEVIRNSDMYFLWKVRQEAKNKK